MKQLKIIEKDFDSAIERNTLIVQSAVQITPEELSILPATSIETLGDVLCQDELLDSNDTNESSTSTLDVVYSNIQTGSICSRTYQYSTYR